MQIFKYQLKLLVRDRSMLFWTILFPLILATFFNLAFAKLSRTESFEVSHVAIVEEKVNLSFKTVLNALSQGDEPILSVQYTSIQQAKDLLKNNDIDGYILVNDELKLIIRDNGISQTILQSVMDNYQHKEKTMQSISLLKPQAIKDIVVQQNQNYFKSQKLSSLDVTVIYFYTLIGMTCLYGGFWGLKITNFTEANLSRQATRLQIAPTSKLKASLTGDLAAFICQYIAIVILLLYLYFGLGIGFGKQIGYILLMSAIGSYVGIVIGHLIGRLFHCQENTKTTILSSFSLFCSFLSGMMVVDLKYLIQEYVPILAYINPVNLITDGLYALYYYPTYERFFLNLTILCFIGFILTVFNILIARRKVYDSL